MSNPVEDLGKEFSQHMRSIMNANMGVSLELGTINKNMALSVDSLGNAIPKGDYMISLHLKQADLDLGTVTLPNKLRGLKSGDRVLVAWAGTEPVVVDIIVSS